MTFSEPCTGTGTLPFFLYRRFSKYLYRCYRLLYYYPFILQCTNNRSMPVNPDLCCCVQVPTWSWWLRRRGRVRCVAGMFGGSLRQRSSPTAGPTTISPRPRQRPIRSKQWGFFVAVPDPGYDIIRMIFSDPLKNMDSESSILIGFWIRDGKNLFKQKLILIL